MKFAVHPQGLAERLDSLLKESKLMLGSKEVDLRYYIGQNQRSAILEPNSEWRPCIYKIRSSFHFLYLDTIDFYTGFWNIYFQDFSSRNRKSLKVYFTSDLKKFQEKIEDNSEKIQTIIPKFSRLQFEFEIVINGEGEDQAKTVKCQVPYDQLYTKTNEISGFFIEDNGMKHSWSAHRQQ